METVFPTATGVVAQFFVGVHKNAGGQIERTGTVVVKRTYDLAPNSVDPSQGGATPSASPVEIFTADVLDGDRVVYETDLVGDKPQGDLIVLPTAAALPQQLFAGGVLRLQRPATAGAIAIDVFGWESRTTDNGPRKIDGGTYPSDPNAYPLPDGVPADFQNRYYNAYRRDSAAAAGMTVQPYLATGTTIRLVRTATPDYGFALGDEVVEATYYTYSTIGPDQESRWQPQPVTVRTDTLVLEPEANRCYVVWRGVWAFDSVPEDRYRRLVVTLAE